MGPPNLDRADAVADTQVMDWPFLARLRRWAAGEPVPPNPLPRPTPRVELDDANARRLLTAVCERWGVPVEYFPGDVERENPERSFRASWQRDGRTDMQCFEWGSNYSRADRFAHAVQAYARAAGLDEFIHLGDWDEVLPLDALQPLEAATDFPGDLSWVVEWSNMAADGATVAGAPLLAFLQANWADYSDTHQPFT